MTDVNATTQEKRSATAGSGARNVGAQAIERQQLVACVELLFFAYRDFTGDADAVLDRYGFGRAHHRVLHFVHRNPGLSVADLLDILRITKQSLSRVLKQLIDEGFVSQREGKSDRRQRLLFATPKGTKLAAKLTTLQTNRIAKAFKAAGLGAGNDAQRFLLAMIGEEDRDRIKSLIGLPTSKE